MGCACVVVWLNEVNTAPGVKLLIMNPKNGGPDTVTLTVAPGFPAPTTCVRKEGLRADIGPVFLDTGGPHTRAIWTGAKPRKRCYATP